MVTLTTYALKDSFFTCCQEHLLPKSPCCAKTVSPKDCRKVAPGSFKHQQAQRRRVGRLPTTRDFAPTSCCVTAELLGNPLHQSSMRRGPLCILGRVQQCSPVLPHNNSTPLLANHAATQLARQQYRCPDTANNGHAAGHVKQHTTIAPARVLLGRGTLLQHGLAHMLSTSQPTPRTSQAKCLAGSCHTCCLLLLVAGPSHLSS